MSENIAGTLKDLIIDIKKIKPRGKNPRRGDVETIKESLEVNGQYRPIVVNKKTGEVLAGNHTLKAAKALGWKKIAATYVEVDEEEAARIVLVDNRANDVATYENTILVELLQDFENFAGTGYTSKDLDELIQSLANSGEYEGQTDADDVPELDESEPTTKPGDVWQLGPHRLMCGDSSNTDDLDKLYKSADIKFLLTDPPYGMNLDTDYSDMKSRIISSRGDTYKPVIGDDQAFDASVLRSYFKDVVEQFWFGADYYRASLSSDDRDGSWLVWDKRSETSDKGFGSGFELIWSANRHKRDLLRHYYFGAFGVEARNRVHPTQKPAPLLQDIITRWADSDCVVADPFLGSGSTLIACERTGRTCYGMELDPAYCDVIVKRWEDHTGQVAELVTT